MKPQQKKNTYHYFFFVTEQKNKKSKITKYQFDHQKQQWKQSQFV
jgi:hypothetical protein